MSSLTLTQAAHLARRAGFSAQDTTLDFLLSADSKEQAVQSIFSLPASMIELPAWHDRQPFTKTNDQMQNSENRKQRDVWSRELKHWWFRQMVTNTSPLQEKMTLFWANHFTSSLKKVKWPPALLAQNQLLRTHALGSFRDLLKGILRDPAILVYLDNARSKKASPNENLARELLELFSMGEGNYTESDVKEMARALTGASINPNTGEYFFNPRFHDNGNKTIFAQTAAFTPDDIADLILTQPQVSPFITEKLWQFFVGSVPSSEQLTSISNVFEASNFEIIPLLETLFNTEAFWQERGNIVKSPMELMVGSTQLFQLQVVTQRQFLQASRAMGQDLFDPPNVKGWPGGKSWYSTSTLAMREKVAQYAADKAKVIPAVQQILAESSVVSLANSTKRNLVKVAVNDPAYQVA